MSNETETETDLRIRAIGNLLFGPDKFEAEVTRLRNVPKPREFPPSHQKDRQQALHELWVSATNVGAALPQSGFEEAIALVENTRLGSISDEKIKAVAHAISYNVHEDEDVDWPLSESAETVVREVLRLLEADDERG